MYLFTTSDYIVLYPIHTGKLNQLKLNRVFEWGFLSDQSNFRRRNRVLWSLGSLAEAICAAAVSNRT